MLFEHQSEAIKFLVARPGAMLCLDMGLGKTRSALLAAQSLFFDHKIDRVLVLAPAACRIAWRQEIDKLDAGAFLPCVYDTKKRQVYGAGKREGRPLPVLILSYALLPNKQHVEALERWCLDGKTALVCDESSFLKNRTAKQTRGAVRIASSCVYRWLLDRHSYRQLPARSLRSGACDGERQRSATRQDVVAVQGAVRRLTDDEYRAAKFPASRWLPESRRAKPKVQTIRITKN